MNINTKKEMIARWLAGDFGNRLQAWKDIDSVIKSGYNGLLVPRELSLAGKYHGNVTVEEAVTNYGTGFYFNEAAPDRYLQMQGEFIDLNGPNLLYSYYQGKMKEALAKAPLTATGLRAVEILRYFMDGSSFDDFQLLRELYVSHAIEFSCYSMTLGDCPGRNTIIWEVRNY